MGLLQAAYRTYEAQKARAGVEYAQEREPLTPVGHLIQNAQIEITISEDGAFLDARALAKTENRTVIPVTVESAGRTRASAPHPLCDQLCYLAPYSSEKYALYMEQLTKWADSQFSHPKVRAVLNYEQGGTILTDLAAKNIITVKENESPGPGRIEGMEYGKCLVRWRVISTAEDAPAAVWQDASLFKAYQDFYDSVRAGEKDWCMIAGERQELCATHPKGVISSTFGAKLISSNDDTGFTYLGRFTRPDQAESVGYLSSQKVHSALRWVAANHGVLIGGRTFVCWNPEGAPVPETMLFAGLPSGPEAPEFTDYQVQLRRTLDGCRQELPPDARVVVAAMEAATTGRLSVTYYNELRGSDFLDRIEQWYDTCVWRTKFGTEQSPNLRRIVNCAFGTEQGRFIKADSRVLEEHVQQLVHCILDRKQVPRDLVRALVTRAGMPLAYSADSREIVLSTACAMIRKSRNDENRHTYKREEWTLALDTSNENRSYLFGRLLAIAEQAERSTYDRGEERPTNAIRMQAMFVQRPMRTWARLDEKLNPYFKKMKPGLCAYFKKMISEIMDHLNPEDTSLDKPLEDVYLLGYYHQRTALTTKKQSNETEEK